MRMRPAFERVWVLGDSLSAGYDASSASNTYVTLLTTAMRLGGAARAVLNRNSYGGKAADAIRQALLDIGFLPDLVILQLGENDRPYGPAFAAAIERLAGLLRGGGRRPLVAAFAVWDPASDAEYAQMTADIRRIVTEAGGLFIDSSGAFRESANRSAGRDVSWLNDPEHLTSDAFHPNDAGHAALAQVAWRTIGQAVRSGPLRETTGYRLPASGRLSRN